MVDMDVAWQVVTPARGIAIRTGRQVTRRLYEPLIQKTVDTEVEAARPPDLRKATTGENPRRSPYDGTNERLFS